MVFVFGVWVWMMRFIVRFVCLALEVMKNVELMQNIKQNRKKQTKIQLR